MTEARTCEFDHKNNPKKITRSTEKLEDVFSGLPSFGDEDGFSVFPDSGDEDDKGGILEDGFAEKVKNQRKVRQRNCEKGRLRDPLVVLGSDIMLMILSCLEARSVALSLLVSRGWCAVASSEIIWSSKVFSGHF